MFWKTARRSRASAILAMAAIALLLLTVLANVLFGSLSGGLAHYQRLVAVVAAIMLALAPLVAFAGVVVGVLARWREGGRRSALALWLSVIVFAVAGLSAVGVVYLASQMRDLNQQLAALTPGPRLSAGAHVTLFNRATLDVPAGWSGNRAGLGILQAADGLGLRRSVPSTDAVSFVDLEVFEPNAKSFADQLSNANKRGHSLLGQFASADGTLTVVLVRTPPSAGLWGIYQLRGRLPMVLLATPAPLNATKSRYLQLYRELTQLLNLRAAVPIP